MSEREREIRQKSRSGRREKDQREKVESRRKYAFERGDSSCVPGSNADAGRERESVKERGGGGVREI